jgi:hypothetical protein
VDGVAGFSSPSNSASAAAAADDPVSDVMSQLIAEFSNITRCENVAVCRQYIEHNQMDLNRAIEAYIDAMY